MLVDDGVPAFGLRFEGQRFDCGSKLGFLQANIAFALARDDLSSDLSAFLNNLSELH
jgi:UTP--glucose-1-phosphate uridylyltransferase